MNRLNVLATILCLTLFLNSCQKDSILNNTHSESQLQNTNIELRDYDEKTCGGVSGLCFPCELEPYWPESRSGKIEIEGIDNKAEVYPIHYFNRRSNDYLIRMPDGDYVITYTRDASTRLQTINNFPHLRQLSNIFKFEFSDLINGKVEDKVIEEVLGESAYKDERGVIKAKSIDIPFGDENPFVFVAGDCSVGVRYTTLQAYYTALNQPTQVATPNSTWMNLVDAAFDQCAVGVNLANKCVDTRCVVASLLSSGLSTHQKGVLSANYVNALFGLTPDEYTWLSSTSDGRTLAIEVVNGLGQTQNLGACFKEDCGLVGGYHQLIRVTMEGLVLSSTDIESLLDFYSLLRCENPSLYSCFREFQQGSESQTFEGCLSNALNNYCLVEFDASGNVVNANTPKLIPFSCESFPLTQIGTDTYKTTVLDWRPRFADASWLGTITDYYELEARSFDIEVTGVPGELECEIQNLVADAFNKANNKAMAFFGINLMYKMPGAEEIMLQIMKADLEAKLAERFPFGVLVNAPSINESVGQPLIDNIPGFEVVDCC